MPPVPSSVHEVFIDNSQVDWLEAQLAANAGSPAIICTHAPPAGCGLRVVQEVHVRNRCAYLNHSSPSASHFVALVEACPDVRLWFSGHYHLSHQYQTSISVVNSCAFVQVGVIGPKATRDGYRQSRVLDGATLRVGRGQGGWAGFGGLLHSDLPLSSILTSLSGDAEGFRLYSMDHGADGALRLDLECRWDDAAPPRPRAPPRGERLAEFGTARWLASELDCGVPGAGPGSDSEAESGRAGRGGARWLVAGPDALLAVQGTEVVEYSASLRSPVGVVLDGLRALREGGVWVGSEACHGAPTAAPLLPNSTPAPPQTPPSHARSSPPSLNSLFQPTIVRWCWWTQTAKPWPTATTPRARSRWKHATLASVTPSPVQSATGRAVFTASTSPTSGE